MLTYGGTDVATFANALKGEEKLYIHYLIFVVLQTDTNVAELSRFR
jgi:hypothetical protein